MVKVVVNIQRVNECNKKIKRKRGGGDKKISYQSPFSFEQYISHREE